jgi:ribosomal protein S18 acetylase RimI-like enzyme
MSKFALELLDGSHDRKSFRCGMESIDRYLNETAYGHTEKGVSLTRVLISADSLKPKPILGYFSLTPCTIEAADWPNVPRGLPKHPVSAILLGRMGVATSMQGSGIGARLLALARQIAFDSLTATGGIGMVVDAANKDLIDFYQRFGFQCISKNSLRLFLPTRSLVVTSSPQ